MKSSMPEIQLIYPSVVTQPPASSPNMMDTENTRASQLMLILRRQKNQLKNIIDEVSKLEWHLGEMFTYSFISWYLLKL